MNFFDEFIKQLILYQFELNSYLSLTIKSINDQNMFISWSIVLVISFLYGLVHAAGPGHGKALVAFYFSTSKHNYIHAFKLGYLISIIHAISALFLTFGIYFLITSMFRQNFDYYSKVTMQVSAVMIILVGFYIIISTYLSKKNKEQKIKRPRNKYLLALSIGIVPCPGVMTIVLFCIMLKQYLLGIIAAITMSIGMGFTISIVGILCITLNKKTNNILQNKSYILEVFGGFLILILGLFLLYIN